MSRASSRPWNPSWAPACAETFPGLLPRRAGGAGHRVQAFCPAKPWRRRNSFPPSIQDLRAPTGGEAVRGTADADVKSILAALESELGARLR